MEWWQKRVKRIKNLPLEVTEAIEKYGVSEGNLPPYVLVGIDKFIGIICFMNNEFHANLLKKIITDNGGEVFLGQTETHPDGSTYAIRDSEEIHRDIDGAIEEIWKK